MTSPSLYLYALVGAGLPGDLGTGLAGEPLRLVRGSGVGAVVGEIDVLPEAGTATLVAHDAAVRRLAELAPAILPVRFGQSLPDERSLVEWLATREKELAEALARVEGCVQMTLRVFGTAESLSNGALQQKREQGEKPQGGVGIKPGVSTPGQRRVFIPSPEGALPASLRDLGDQMVPSPGVETPGFMPAPLTGLPPGPGTHYLEERRRARTLPEIAPLREVLRPLLRAERIERSLGQGLLLGTAYDLVERGEAGEYTRLIAEMAPRLEPLRVTASGPWPPYAFAPGLAG